MQRGFFLKLKRYWRLTIQGIPVVLASNTDRSEIERALLDAGIRSHFSHVFSAMDCEAPKPDPTVYMKASATGVAKSDILVFEDSAKGLKRLKSRFDSLGYSRPALWN